jgi:hypothetical protein
MASWPRPDGPAADNDVLVL